MTSIKPAARWNLFYSSALAASLALAESPIAASAQQLIAWPIGRHSLQSLLPGQPIRPLPPRPLPPTARPLPIPTPTPTPRPITIEDGAPIELQATRIEGSIEDQLANLTFHIRFHNPTNQRLEGVLMIPIPAETALSGFQMTMGGKMVSGELLEAAQASTIYENIVRSMRDPGLLELVGERLVRARVFPIEPHGNIDIRMTLTQVLHKDAGLVSLRVPLRSAQMLAAHKEATSVRLKLNASAPIRTLYSPLPGVKIARQGERAATVSFEEGSAGSANDLALFFSTRQDPLAAGLLAYREPGEDGTFMLTLSPKAKVEGAAYTPKDIVFVLDRSGSMAENGKMDQARKALKHCVERLSPQDRFGIVDFGTGVESMESRLLAGTPENRARGVRYIDAIEPSGGTNIEGGLREGLGLLGRAEGRVPMIFFITDGVPTAGQTDVAQLLRIAGDANSALRARLFSFGVGSDVNTLLLDKLAEGNGGARDYVGPGEEIEGKVSSLYGKIAKPALTDVKLSWEGVEPSSVYPRPVPDIFHGSELVLTGRYKAGAKGRLIITGRAGGKPARFEFPIELPAEASRNSFLPKLWASQRVAHELDAIRLSGRAADPEVVNDIVKLAKRYGIVTPYTSYLITEDGMDMTRARAAATRNFGNIAAEAALSGFGSGGAGLSVAATRGNSQRAQKASNFLSAAKGMISGAASNFDGGGAAAAPAMAFAMADKEARLEFKREGRSVAQTRSVAGKTFYLRDGLWTDGDYELLESKPAPKKIVYLSAEYFELTHKNPELGRYLSVGSRVLLVHRGTAYEIVER